jgi:hypothetical protein
MVNVQEKHSLRIIVVVEFLCARIVVTLLNYDYYGYIDHIVIDLDSYACDYVDIVVVELVDRSDYLFDA